MSYFTAKTYEIFPTGLYKIARNCAGCGGKSIYQCTNKIRVNANGKQIDVWLIYQCSKCKHTYNLAVYSRINRAALEKNEYAALLQNDPQMVLRYGMNRDIFRRNGIKELEGPAYILRELAGDISENTITVRDPFHLKIRSDKLLADCLGISRAEAKKLLEMGLVSAKQPSTDEIRFGF